MWSSAGRVTEIGIVVTIQSERVVKDELMSSWVAKFTVLEKWLEHMIPIFQLPPVPKATRDEMSSVITCASGKMLPRLKASVGQLASLARPPAVVALTYTWRSKEPEGRDTKVVHSRPFVSLSSTRASVWSSLTLTGKPTSN